MSISNFPANLLHAIQQNYLRRAWELSLMAELGYRALATKEVFPNNIGETITRTRPGLLQAVTTPLNPSTITNLDDGLSPTNWFVEQYVLSINEYANTMDLNIVGNQVGIADQFIENASRLGENARRTLDFLARDTLLNAYMGGNTRLNATLGSPNATISVDDIRGFQFVIPTSGTDTGRQVPVSNTNPMAVSVNGTTYTLIAATADVSNISTVVFPGGDTGGNGISGTLTFSTSVSVLNGTSGNSVISAFAPTIIRPNNKSTFNGSNTGQLNSNDLITLRDLRSAVTQLRNNAVPDIDGNYLAVISPTTLQELYQDQEFVFLFRGTEFKSEEYRNFYVNHALGLSIAVTNLAPVQSLGSLLIQRPIIVGKDCLIEGKFAGMRAVMETRFGMEISDITEKNDVMMVTRTPLDRLRQIVAQSWFFVGGWTAPTDQTASSTYIPTASNAYYKRAVIIEHA